MLTIEFITMNQRACFYQLNYVECQINNGTTQGNKMHQQQNMKIQNILNNIELQA